MGPGTGDSVAWGGETGSCGLPWGDENSGSFHSGLCNGLFLKLLACEYICDFWGLSQIIPSVSFKRQSSAQWDVIVSPRGVEIGSWGQQKNLLLYVLSTLYIQYINSCTVYL